MLDSGKVLSYFSLFTDLSGDTLEKWEVICVAAASRLESMLKDNIDTEKHSERLCITGAALAYSDYLLLGTSFSSSNASEVKIGDISVKNSGGTLGVQQDSEGIRDYFLGQISDLIRPDAFAFVLVGDCRKPDTDY